MVLNVPGSLSEYNDCRDSRSHTKHTHKITSSDKSSSRIKIWIMAARSYTPHPLKKANLNAIMCSPHWHKNFCLNNSIFKSKTLLCDYLRVFPSGGENTHVSFILSSYIRKYQQTIIACKTKDSNQRTTGSRI
jgi:hypothetical protein